MSKRIQQQLRGRPRRNRTIRAHHERRLGKRLVVLAAVGLMAAACTSPSPSDQGARSRAVTTTAFQLPTTANNRSIPDPSEFVDKVDNPYFPLEPGTIFKLRGDTEDGIEREKIKVTNDTKEILGVTTTVVKDVVWINGELHEFTYDWYAQDSDGNVWYFGEDTATYKNGKVESRSGSWEAGIDGAEAGIIMVADPQVNNAFRQEFYKGEAEDMAWIVATGGKKEVPAGKYDQVVRTLEWTRLEPKIVVEKFHAPGVGLISEKGLSGGKENVELLEVIHPE